MAFLIEAFEKIFEKLIEFTHLFLDMKEEKEKLGEMKEDLLSSEHHAVSKNKEPLSTHHTSQSHTDVSWAQKVSKPLGSIHR